MRRPAAVELLQRPAPRKLSVSSFWQKTWSNRGWRASILWPASCLYALINAARRLLYRARILPVAALEVPVIVVGNVIAGGGGKTPLVMVLVAHLREKGVVAGVISRGYGRHGSAPQEVFPDTPMQESGDEPALIKRSTGAAVFVANRRVDAGRALLAVHPETDVIIADDGLQHFALDRDIEIVVFDDRGLGNGWLLPAGPLRQAWPLSANSLPIVLHTGAHAAFAGFTSIRELDDHAISADGRQVALASLIDQPLVAIAGIANPDAFFRMLRLRGLTLATTVPLPDHDDLADIKLDQYTGRTVLCTEKDAVKLFRKPRPAGVELLAVPLRFMPEPSFFASFDASLDRVRSALPSRHGQQTS
jgi:tetraacyldisaccharide 4'-kinase